MRARTITRTASAVAVAVLAALAWTSPALAGADGMPSQSVLDLPASSPGNSTGRAGWGDLAGGVDARPYVQSLSVTNGTTTTPVIVSGTTSAPNPAAGTVTAAIAPVNLCAAGEAPAQGRCYATPNRVQITLGYQTSQAEVVGRDFSAPSSPLAVPVTDQTIFDMTIALNTLGTSLRWSQLNGDLLYWKPTGLGTPQATLHVRFRPVVTPGVNTFPEGSGCSATPIFNCDIAQADTTLLSGSLLLSLDDTLDRSLTGAVFAIQGALAGYLEPKNGPTGPQLDLQVASTHRAPDGSLQQGTLQALLPAASLLSMYSLLPADAARSFSTTRTGAAGTSAAPVYDVWTAPANGSDGLFVRVADITFSTPTYRVSSKVPKLKVKLTRGRLLTTASTTVSACSAKVRCVAVLYDLGSATANRYATPKAKKVGSKTFASRTLRVAAPSRLLAKRRTALVVVRAAKTGRVVGSAVVRT